MSFSGLRYVQQKEKQLVQTLDKNLHFGLIGVDVSRLIVQARRGKLRSLDFLASTTEKEQIFEIYIREVFSSKGLSCFSFPPYKNRALQGRRQKNSLEKGKNFLRDAKLE
jgi:hypothetical protein